MKSNINLSSNVYIRNEKTIIEDIKYLNSITGYSALKKLKDIHSIGTLKKISFNNVQQKELEEIPNCALAKNKEQTHGKVLVDGAVKWVGRCEYNKCINFRNCPDAQHINRIKTEDQIIEQVIEQPCTIFTLPNPSLFVTTIEEITKDIEIPEPELDKTPYIIDKDDNIKTYKDDFDKIIDPKPIIESNINSRILVNAGPGTGKTYSVIERIFYIIENQLANPENILALCYGRDAVKVIKDRIEEGIKNNKLPFEANQVGVYTFDSFATRYLIGLDEELEGLSYDDRIKLFNKKINKQDFTKKDLEYLIIDELQDIVNFRAKMVLNILNCVECGFLLLGDKCQAIYDYDTIEEQPINSTKFYNQLMTFANQLELYELTKNNRQSEALSTFTSEIRNVLLSESCKVQNEYVETATEKIEKYNRKVGSVGKIKFNLSDRNSILCRNNGETLMITSYLNKDKVSHKILRGNTSTLKINRFIADIFWDFVDKDINFEQFLNRYILRVCDDLESAHNKFNLICGLIGENEGKSINIDELKKALITEQNLPKQLLANDEKDIIVSTIHKSKGQEFDNVYCLASKFTISDDTAEEARVRYVAYTRPKKTLKIIEKNKIGSWIFKSSPYRTFRIEYKSKKYYRCRDIAINEDSHIDQASFASNLDVQKYISEKVKKFDMLEVVYSLKHKKYEIFHDNNKIGCLSKNTVREFTSIINSTTDRRNIPQKLTGLYVYNVYSYINNSYNDKISGIHKKTNIWLAVEIIGLGKVEY